MKEIIARLWGILCVAVLFWSAGGTAEVEVPLAGSNAARPSVYLPNPPRFLVGDPERDRIVVIDAVSGALTKEIPTGNAPVALALAKDEKYVACVNRLDDSVILYSAETLDKIAEVSVEHGPISVAPTANHDFAVVHTFSETVLAVEGDTLSTRPITRLQGAVPCKVVGPGRTLLVLCKNAPFVYAVDIQLGTALPLTSEKAVTDAYSPRNGLFLCLSDGVPFVWEVGLPALREADPAQVVYPVGYSGIPWLLKDRPAYALVPSLAASYGEVKAAELLSGVPTTMAVGREAVLVVQAQRAVLLPQEAEPQSNESLVRIAATRSISSSPTEESNTATAEHAPAMGEEQEQTPPETSAQPAHADAEPSGSPSNAKDTGTVKTKSPSHPQAPRVEKYPLRSEVRVPEFAQGPPSLRLNQLSRRTISEALRQPTEFGSVETGFQPPDWREPFRDIQADRTIQSLDSDTTLLQGNVHLRLGDMLFRADEFSYSEQRGEVHAKGQVHITQANSTIDAERVNYVLPPRESVEQMIVPPLQSPLSEEELAKKRLTLGRLQADKVKIVEPTRELVADSLDYDFSTQQGTLTGVRGRAGIYYYAAEKIVLKGEKTATAENVWITTCDHDPPHYRLKLKTLDVENGQFQAGKAIQMQVLNTDTPFFLPRWRTGVKGEYPWNIDYDTGRRGEIGFFANVGVQVDVTPDVSIGPRIIMTQKEGVGLGGDLYYDFMENPASRLYRTRGEVHGIYTTEDRGYLHLYHRYQYTDDLAVKVQVEQWSDENFYKDFFQAYKNRTTPRTFVEAAYTQPTYIATGVVRANTHSWIDETERMPEVTFHLLERPIGHNLYFSFDTITGYNAAEPKGPDAARSVNLARLSYDWNVTPWFNVLPWWQVEGTWYSHQRDEDADAARLSTTQGITLQTRLHRVYPGFWNFSEIKHVVIPSVTLSYRPTPTEHFSDVPYFDALDSVFGRTRVESKLANVFYGKDAATGKVYQLGSINFYQGNDIWNEDKTSDDYEVEMDLRPRPWWGVQLSGERHLVSGKTTLEDLQLDWQRIVDIWQRTAYQAESEFTFNSRFTDYNRLLAQLYYDNTYSGGKWQARLGFAYTETGNEVFNREILYGAGYRLGEHWGFSFEHRYDFESDELRSQTYELRRTLHCWETALRLRERPSGTDISVEFNIRAFPGSRLRF